MKATLITKAIKGLMVLGISAVVFGIGASTPAKADGWRDRRRVEVIPAPRVVLSIGPVQLVAPCAPVVVVDHRYDHDWRWRRDHCR